MKTLYLSKARKLFVNGTTPVHIQRANIRSWAAAVRYLGPKWIALRPVRRTQEVID